MSLLHTGFTRRSFVMLNNEFILDCFRFDDEVLTLPNLTFIF
jgi:hypothetical protein